MKYYIIRFKGSDFGHCFILDFSLTQVSTLMKEGTIIHCLESHDGEAKEAILDCSSIAVISEK